MEAATASGYTQAAPPSRCTDDRLGANYKCVVPAAAAADGSAANWLQLNLHGSSRLLAVRVFAECLTCASGLLTFEVWVGDDYWQPSQRCYSGEAAVNGWDALYLPCVATGRYVRLRLTGTRSRALTLARFEAFVGSAGDLVPAPAQVDTSGLRVLDRSEISQAVFPATGKSADGCIDGDTATSCGYDAMACGDGEAGTGTDATASCTLEAACAAFPNAMLPESCLAVTQEAAVECGQPIADGPHLDIHLVAARSLRAIELHVPPGSLDLGYFELSSGLSDTQLQPCSPVGDHVADDTGGPFTYLCGEAGGTPAACMSNTGEAGEVVCENHGDDEAQCRATAGCRWQPAVGDACMSETGAAGEVLCENHGHDEAQCVEIVGCQWQTATGAACMSKTGETDEVLCENHTDDEAQCLATAGCQWQTAISDTAALVRVTLPGTNRTLRLLEVKLHVSTDGAALSPLPPPSPPPPETKTEVASGANGQALQAALAGGVPGAPRRVELGAGTHALDATLRIDATTTGGVSELWLVGAGTADGGAAATVAAPPPGATRRRRRLSNGTASDDNGGAAVAATISVVGSVVVHLQGLVLRGAHGTAAIAASGGATLVLHGCELRNASGTSAMQLSGEGTVVTAYNSTFVGNEASDAGGAALVSDGARLEVSDGAFSGNRAARGGALAVTGAHSRARVAASLMEANVATEAGGALHVAAGGAVVLANTALLSGNVAPSGGSVWLHDAAAVSYELPAPLGRWMQAIGGVATLAPRPEGYGDLPYACAPGVFGNSYEPTAQSGPTCSAACPAGHFCTSLSIVPQRCPTGSFCAIGSGSPTNCPEGYTSDEEGLASAAECALCKAGHWCAQGRSVACLADTYNPTTGNLSLDACLACPEHSETVGDAATSPRDCLCSVSYYDASNATERGPPECRPCPSAATQCDEVGTTLATLPVLAGHWRTSSRSTDIRQCPSRYTGGSNGTTLLSGCLGGAGAADELCGEWLAGPLCTQCNASGGRYYDAYDFACRECDFSPSRSATAIIVGAVLLGLGAACGVRVRRLLRRGRLKRLLAFLHQMRRLRRRLTVKAKQCVSFYQIVTRVPQIYQVTLPTTVSTAISYFSVVSIVSFDGVGLPLQCWGTAFSGNEAYLTRLIFTAIFPVLLIALVFGCTVLRELLPGSAVMLSLRPRTDSVTPQPPRSLDARGRPRRLHQGVMNAMPWALRLSYLAFPIVSSQAFSALNCHCFDEGASFMVADFGVMCEAHGCADGSGDNYTPQYATIRTWAIVIIVFWAVCCPLLYLALLVSVRNALRDEQPTPLSTALEFLHQEYEPHVFFWELIDSTKKLVLVGFLSLPGLPGTTTQLITAFVFSICYLMLQMQAAPFRRHEDDFLAMATSFSLVFVFFFCIILREGVLIEKVSERLTDEVRANFDIDGWWLGIGLLICVLTALVLAFGMMVLHVLAEAREARRQHAVEDRLKQLVERDAPTDQEVLALEELVEAEGHGGTHKLPDSLRQRRIDFDALEFAANARISSGAFGEVYRASHRDRPVAVKKLVRARVADKAALHGFAAEGALLARLEHPNIVQLFGVCWSVEMASFWLVLELCERGSLEQLLLGGGGMGGGGMGGMGMGGGIGCADGEGGGATPSPSDPLPWEKRRLKIASDVASGVAYLHAQTPPLVHRDLKPANVLLTDEWRAKLCDFGTTREATLATMTAVGTPLYEAPEVMRREQYDELCDVWSFGVMLSVLETRRQPYADVDVDRLIQDDRYALRGSANPSDPVQMVLRAIENNRLAPSLPPSSPLAPLVARCVAFDAEERPPFALIPGLLDAVEALAPTPPPRSRAARTTERLAEESNCHGFHAHAAPTKDRPSRTFGRPSQSQRHAERSAEELKAKSRKRHDQNRQKWRAAEVHSSVSTTNQVGDSFGTRIHRLTRVLQRGGQALPAPGRNEGAGPAAAAAAREGPEPVRV